MKIPNTQIELGKWYPASQIPPDIKWDADTAYNLLLGIQNQGVIAGFYDILEGRYYWYCERYGSFDDELINGFKHDEEINNCLDWVYELASEVMCWMIVPSPPELVPVNNGENDDEQEEDDQPEQSDELRIWEIGRILPLNPN